MRLLSIGIFCIFLSAGSIAAPQAARTEHATAPTSALTKPVRHIVTVDGHPLALWEKRPTSPRASILLVHGRTWSSLPNFDLQVPGEDRSVMNALARAGYAAYALDLRGYGATPRDASGWLTPDRAVEDVSAVLEWIRAQNPTHKFAPTLLGYSRGSSLAVLVAQRHPQAMSTLVLYAFPAESNAKRAANEIDSDTPPRAATTAAAAASDFITPSAASQTIIDAYIQQALASDPVRVDWQHEERLAFDATQVHVPTLLLYGTRDPFSDPDQRWKVFAALGTDDRAWVILPNSDHAAHVENVHAQWVRAVVNFIELPRAK